MKAYRRLSFLCYMDRMLRFLMPCNPLIFTPRQIKQLFCAEQRSAKQDVFPLDLQEEFIYYSLAVDPFPKHS